MKTTLVNYCLAFMVLFGTFSCSEDEAPLETPNETSVADEILRLVNEHRQGQGLPVLEKSSTADQLAIEHSRYMIAQGEISHDNRDAKFDELKDKENARGFGENVAFGQSSAQSVMTAWLNSSGHRANIEGNYTHIGIGAVTDENGRYYYTQIFYR
ncbi:CAP domain-containing protein [Aquimarina gracilis]|uniref:CAP domain-containing protein n=1 Tax=Aquimarina gracilis TaxID=874422 RepID=A0ABU5ZNS3_9FLAO|nr:CAP domain-containing protein [Aquimarina gracilis]MEB3343824.1 CAP domain-containing protein [Aquimarina gracilis]